MNVSRKDPGRKDPTKEQLYIAPWQSWDQGIEEDASMDTAISRG